jgi:hypothetical protein
MRGKIRCVPIKNSVASGLADTVFKN